MTLGSFIMNGETYYLVPYKTEEELDNIRKACGFDLGYCKCGCGQKTNVASCTKASFGWVKGKHLDFIHGHNATGSNNYRWKGGKHITTHGYNKTLQPDHPHADAHGHVLEAVLIAEKALGKHLPKRAKIHHIDGNQLNDTPGNIVVCEDQAYHMLLEKRTRAYKACGHADWLKCWFCKEYDNPKNMYTYTRPGGNNSVIGFHRACQAKYKREKD